MLMPGEPSDALALHAKEKQIHAVVISGSPEHIKFAADHGLQLLRKRFLMPDLFGALDDALSSGELGQRKV